MDTEQRLDVPLGTETRDERRRRLGLEYNRKYREEHKERVAASRLAYKNSDKGKEKRKEWDTNNADVVATSKRKWYEQHKEEVCRQAIVFAKANPAWKASHCAKRRASKLKALPPWTTEDDLFLIQEAHDLARLRKEQFGFPWHVDHIVPLQGKKVCGLHIWWNMQVIPGSLNSVKGNRYED